MLVGDDQVIGGELADVAVQGGELLALLGPTDDDVAALHIAVVEGVHGLAVLQHHIVGDVHDVVDGADAHAPQPLPHPLGGGADLYVPHHPGGVPGHQVGGGSLDVQQVRQHAVGAALHLRLMEGQGLLIGGGHLPGQADDAEAVRPVGGDLKLHHMVVGANDGLDVVAVLDALLVEDEDAVGDAVGELLLLGVEVGQRADDVGFGVVGHQVPLVEVGADGIRHSGGAAQVQTGVEGVVRLNGALQDLGAHHGPEHLVPGLDVRGDGGLVLVQGVVVVQNGGGDDGGVGEVPLVQAQLGEAAHHAVGHHAPQLALLDLLAAGEGGVVQGHGHHVAGVDVPGAGDDLDGGALPHVQLADPHMVGIRVALHGEDGAHHHVGDLGPPVLGGLHLGPGEGHGLRELFIIGINVHELVQPLSA